MRGKGIRVMRRLTGRSRLRSALALRFLGLSHTGNGSDCSLPDSSDLGNYVSYLYCMSEMHEIRLTSSEDSLLQAFGFRLEEYNLHSVDSNAIKGCANPRSLVRTWIQDEGIHLEVVELSRDLLLLCNVTDESIWYYLIDHMLKCGLQRVLCVTCTMIIHRNILTEICFGSIGLEVLKALICLNEAASVKIEQVNPISQIII